MTEPLSTPAAQGTVADALLKHFGDSNRTTLTAREAGRQAANVARQVLAAPASPSPEALPASGVEAVLEQLRIEAADDHYHDMWQQGVRYAISEMKDALASLASDASPRGEAVYRFLELGELIEAGDEAPSDDCSRWEPVNRWAVGYPRTAILKIIRRRVYAHPAPATVETARAHAVDLEQCSLFVDSPALKKSMSDAAVFLRALAPATEGRKR